MFVRIVMLFSIVIAASSLKAADRVIPELPTPDEKIRVIIDTDAACEIDDLYAIALAILSPEKFEIEGFVAAHWGDSGGPSGIERSYDLINTVLEKAGMAGQFPVKRGSHPFRYSSVPEPSEGVDFIIERAMASSSEDPLWIISLGACTDVSAAYLQEPEIKDRVRVLWHGRTLWPRVCTNFNVTNDLKAVRILFGSEMPFVLFDTGTHIYCPMELSKEKIASQGELGKYLHEYRFKHPGYQLPTKGFFDLGDVAVLIDPTIVQQDVVESPSVNSDLSYDHKKTHGKMRRLYDIDGDRTFEILFEKLANKYGQ